MNFFTGRHARIADAIVDVIGAVALGIAGAAVLFLWLSH